MLLVLCYRLDLPIDSDHTRIRRANDRLRDLLSELERRPTVQVNLSLSGAALACLARDGHEQSIQQVRALADERQIELLGTAAHGALLPLLPEPEVVRQVELNHRTNREWFGDVYRPETLWPPELAVSPRLAQQASLLGFTSMLADEASMRVWPASWQWDRIDGVLGESGFFVLPSHRAASERMRRGVISARRELEQYVPAVESALDLRHLTITVELTECEIVSIPSDAIARVRTIRLQDLFMEVALEGTTNLLSSSRRSTPDEVDRGLPFAAWFSPGNERHSLQWRLLNEAVELLRGLESRGYAALPTVGRLRRTLDAVERESWWRLQGDASALSDALEGLSDIVDAGQLGRVLRACAVLGARTGTTPAAEAHGSAASAP